MPVKHGFWLDLWFFNRLVVTDTNKNQNNVLDDLFRKRYLYVIFHAFLGVHRDSPGCVHRPSTPAERAPSLEVLKFPTKQYDDPKNDSC